MDLNRVRVLPPVLVCAALGSSALAAVPTVVSNTSNLQPNSVNVIELLITGSDAIAGENLNFQINTAASGPTFTAVDILSGTIFGPSNTGQGGAGIINSGTFAGHIAVVSTTTNPNPGFAQSVIDNGTLATLTITTGPASGSLFDLNMVNTLNGPSNLVIQNGTSVTTIPISYVTNHFSIGATADRQWITNGGGTWGLDSNWTPFAPYTTGDLANFLTAGNGTVTLDGNRTAGVVTFNNTSAGYTIAQGTSGTLTLDNGTNTPAISDLGGLHTISAPIALTAATNVTVANNGDTLTISGNISGAVPLSLSGAGKLTLTGANSYSTTNIAGGSTLQLGNGGATGSLGTGAVNNAGTLAINLSGTPTIANAISGTGNLLVSGPGTVTVTGAANYSGSTTINAGKLAFGGGVSHVIAGVSGAGALQVLAGTTLTANGVSPASLEVDGNLTIQSGIGSAGTSKVNSLTIASTINATSVIYTGTLNISDNAFIEESGGVADKSDKIATLNSAITSGSNGATWTGTGLTSSTAQADSAHLGIGVFDNAILGKTSFGGQSVDSNSILTAVSHLGDANRDGVVDLQDLSIVTNHWQSKQNNWASGDLNRDGVVDLGDLSLVTNNWQETSSFKQVASVIQGGMEAAPAPEPGSLAILAIGISAVLVKRRK